MEMRFGSWVANEAAAPIHLERYHLAAFFGFAAAYGVIGKAVAEPLSTPFQAFEALPPFEKAQWLSRVVSQVHVFVALCLATHALVAVDCFWCVESVVYLRSRPIELALANTGGFLFYDLLDMLKNRATHGRLDGGPLILAHHVFGFVGYFLSWSYARCGFIYCVPARVRSRVPPPGKNVPRRSTCSPRCRRPS